MTKPALIVKLGQIQDLKLKNHLNFIQQPLTQTMMTLIKKISEGLNENACLVALKIALTRSTLAVTALRA